MTITLKGLSRISAKRVVVALALLFLALFVSIFAYFIAVGIKQTQERFEEQSAAGAQVVATNAYWISEVANQTLRRVDTALGPEMSASPEEFAPVLEDLPAITEVYVIDALARTIYSTVPGAEQVSVADREYFTALRDGAAFYTSPMIVSRLTDDQIFVFSRRVERSGTFAGAIMVSFSGKLLEDLYTTLGLETGSTVSLVRDDGQLVARFPPAEAPIDLSNLPLFTEYLRDSDHGTYVSPTSPVDGIARVVSFRRIPDTHLVALASIASGPGWTAFTGAIVTVLFITSPIILGLVLGCWWIIKLLSRDARQAADLQAAADLNTMLFREIHHRVKNNLQSVLALVRMQNIPDEAKRDLQARFAAMAAMHEHIYKYDRYLDIDAHDFVPAVVDQVKLAYGASAELAYDVEHLAVDRDHATPLALLLSEVVTNAFKYAFVDRTDGGLLAISLKGLPDGMALLTVQDNGIGMDIDGERKSMGMRLIKGVVGQMGGTFTFRSENGLIFEARLSLSTEQRRAAVA